MRFYFKTSDLRELAKGVATMNAKLGGGFTEFKEANVQSRKRKSVHGRVTKIVAKASTREDMYTVAVTQLTKELGSFSKIDFAKVLELLGVSNTQKSIELLLESNIIYEAELGRYKSV